MHHPVRRNEYKGNVSSSRNSRPYYPPTRTRSYWEATLTEPYTPQTPQAHPPPSRALEESIRGLALTDTWEQDPQRPVYTHYAPTGATRIDRIYLSKTDINRKTGIEIIPTAFTDHHAVVLRLTIPAHVAQNKRRLENGPPPAQDNVIRSKINREWEQWRKHRRFYPDVVGVPRKNTPQAPYMTRRSRAQQEPQHHGKPFIRMSL
jgi:hypothetical protein